MRKHKRMRLSAFAGAALASIVAAGCAVDPNLAPNHAISSASIDLPPQSLPATLLPDAKVQNDVSSLEVAVPPLPSVNESSSPAAVTRGSSDAVAARPRAQLSFRADLAPQDESREEFLGLEECERASYDEGMEGPVGRIDALPTYCPGPLEL